MMEAHGVDAGEHGGARAQRLADDGKTPLFFAADGRLLAGVIAVADTVKPTSARRRGASCKAMGIRTVMLTGDNERTAAGHPAPRWAWTR